MGKVTEIQRLREILTKVSRAMEYYASHFSSPKLHEAKSMKEQTEISQWEQALFLSVFH